MIKKIDFYGDIKSETGVIMAFSKIHQLLGFSKLVASSARGFDIDSMDYNPDIAGGKDFSEWATSHCYRVTTSKNNPKFADDNLPPRSKILFYQNGFIIGGFTVVRYEIIKRPRSEREWKLYKKLTDYPASLYTRSVEQYKDGEWLCGHIFYKDFFDIRNLKIRLSDVTKKKMSRHGKINTTRDEYYRIVAE